MSLVALLLTALAIGLETIEQTCFKAASHWKSTTARGLFTALGMGLNLGGMAVLLLVLRHAPLGVVVPLLASTNVSVAIAGSLFFRERITGRRWLGIGMITAGVALVSSAIRE